MRYQELCQVLALFMTIGLGGCATTVVPPVRGCVVDGAGTPIAGATVTIAPVDSPQEKPRHVKTDRLGRFARREERRWFVALPVAAHAIGFEFSATASYEGTQSAPKRFGGGLLTQQLFGLTNRSKLYDVGELVVPNGRHPRNAS